MIQIHPIPAPIATAAWQGKPDANGQMPERHISDGGGNPCRNCLSDIAAGEDMLALAARPFRTLSPYAETGPIFLCAADCTRWTGSGLPPVLAQRPQFLMRGYSAEERIVEGTGGVVATPEIIATAERLFTDPRVAYIDVRSASNSCWMARIARADDSGT